MKSATGSFSITSLIRSRSCSVIRSSPGLDAELVDRPVCERLRERVVDEAVLLDERDAVEARARDRDLEVVAAARAVDHGELGRVRERLCEQLLQRLYGHAGHRSRRAWNAPHIE